MVAATKAGTMMIHCGGKMATFDELKEVELPEETDTYIPVAHEDLVGQIYRTGEKLLHGYEKDSEQFALARDGQRMFGLISYRNGDGGEEMGMAVGFRNSYDKSMKIGVAIGARVFVCDNLALSGGINVMHLHTGNVLEALRNSVVLAMHDATDHFVEIRKDAKLLQEIEVDDDRAARFMGLAYGRGILKDRQLAVATRAWRRPDQEDFKPRTAWSVYNASTEALKSTPPNKVMEAHLNLHDLAIDQLLNGGDSVANPDDLIREQIGA